MLFIRVSSEILLSFSPGTPRILCCIPQHNNASCNFRCCWKSEEVLWQYSNYSDRTFNGRGNGFILWAWFNGNYNLAVLARLGIMHTTFCGLKLPLTSFHNYYLHFAAGRGFEYLMEPLYLESWFLILEIYIAASRAG